MATPFEDLSLPLHQGTHEHWKQNEIQGKALTMRAQLIGRKIAMPIATVLMLLAGSESGLASHDLASGGDPMMGSARGFTCSIC